MMRDKLGLIAPAEDDDDLIAELTDVLQVVETDLSIFYRRLADVAPSDPNGSAIQDFATLRDAYYDPEGIGDEDRGRILAWLDRYRARARAEGRRDADRRAAMNRVNPKYVLRNYMAQLAIDAAENGDYGPVDELADVLRHPYDEQPERERHAEKRPDWARSRPGCSMLSCSS